MDRRVTSIVAPVVLVAALLYWVAWRSQVIRAPGEPASRAVVEETQRIQNDLEHGRKVYAQLDMKPVGEVASLEQLDEELGAQIAADMQQYVSDSKPGHDAKSLERIRNDVIGLMYHRWFAPSFDDYDRFMVEAGYVLPDTYAELGDGRKDSLRISFEMWTGQPFDPTRSPRESLRLMWDADRGGTGRAARLEAFAVDPDGVEFGVKTASLTSYSTVEFEGPLGRVGWQGGQTGTIPRYWLPRSGTYHEKVQAGQQVELAKVGVILRFANGQTLPFCFSCWYDVQTDRWYLYSVAMANYQIEGFGSVYF